MRIIAGEWRGRRLIAPAGEGTRPTADRVRQALFDMLMHAPWGGHEVLAGAHVLDVFAGTGALGLEALSRGAASATFVENDAAALAALRANIAACRAGQQAAVLALDIHAVPHCIPGGVPSALVFLDPPYRQARAAAEAIAILTSRGWLASRAIVAVETSAHEAPELPGAEMLAERVHGAARVTVWRADP